ncbi:putative thymidylate kinase [Toxocara canis]|uniref:dTMP kinase n=1 Tax=Toxocara canis TaxID=6265 RepID=A0A0B2VL91_TOXCA|nr:putative thymidylate kinase [Toxocara canis]
MVKRGALIVFEGCDRAGKSTQALRMVRRIQAHGEAAELIAFPGTEATRRPSIFLFPPFETLLDSSSPDRSSDLGKFIDQYLKGEVEMGPREAHLVFAANRQALVETMREKLLHGTHLVVDRYTYSGIAYTLAKGLDVSLEWAKMHDIGILKPDRVFYFDLSPDEARKRSGFGDERLEAYDYQCTVYKFMQTLGSQNADIWKVIDASKSMDEVSADVWDLMEPVLGSAASKPVEYIELEAPPLGIWLRNYVLGLAKWIGLL